MMEFGKYYTFNKFYIDFQLQKSSNLHKNGQNRLDQIRIWYFKINQVFFLVGYAFFDHFQWIWSHDMACAAGFVSYFLSASSILNRTRLANFSNEIFLVSTIFFSLCVYLLFDSNAIGTCSNWFFFLSPNEFQWKTAIYGKMQAMQCIWMWVRKYKKIKSTSHKIPWTRPVEKNQT